MIPTAVFATYFDTVSATTLKELNIGNNVDIDDLADVNGFNH